MQPSHESSAITRQPAAVPGALPSHLGRVAVLALMVLLIALPLATYWLPHELANWRMAKALDAQLDGAWPTAAQWADRAIAAWPKGAQLLALRASLRRQCGDLAGSLRDARRVVQLAPERAMGYVERGFTLQRMGRYREAVGDFKKLLAIIDQRLDYDQSRSAHLAYAEGLNGYAYARALADVELDEALADVEQAIHIGGALEHFVDTRGYIHYRLGHLHLALRDLDVALTKADFSPQRAALERRMRATVDARRLQLAGMQLEQVQGELLYHRGLVYQALGMEDAAGKDLTRARKLGFHPADAGHAGPQAERDDSAAAPRSDRHHTAMRRGQSPLR